MQNLKPVASLYSWAGQFESNLVGNPEDRFSRDVAHIWSLYSTNDSLRFFFNLIPKSQAINHYFFLLGNNRKREYCNAPMFSDRQVWANSADPDQTAPLIRVYSVCNSLSIFCMYHSMVKPSCSTFKVIIENFSDIQMFRSFMVNQPDARVH